MSKIFKLKCGQDISASNGNSLGFIFVLTKVIAAIYECSDIAKNRSNKATRIRGKTFI